MDKRIKVLVLEGLTADDLLKLKAGGFFDGAAMPLPEGVQGQAATLKVAEVQPAPVPVEVKPVPLPGDLASRESMPGQVYVARGNGWVAEDPPVAAKPVVPPEVAQVIETGRQVGLDLVPAPEAAPVKERARKAAPVEVAPAAKAAEPAKAPDAVNLEALAGFAKLRDLLEYAHGAGVPAAGLVEWCLSVKDSVPLLSRIADIPGRVQRTLEVMGLVS